MLWDIFLLIGQQHCQVWHVGFFSDERKHFWNKFLLKGTEIVFNWFTVCKNFHFTHLHQNRMLRRSIYCNCFYITNNIFENSQAGRCVLWQLGLNFAKMCDNCFHFIFYHKIKLDMSYKIICHMLFVSMLTKKPRQVSLFVKFVGSFVSLLLNLRSFTLICAWIINKILSQSMWAHIHLCVCVFMHVLVHTVKAPAACMRTHASVPTWINVYNP